MELVKHPNLILSAVSTDVELNDEARAFISDMEIFFKTGLKWGIPVGLAAPQVGNNWNIFIALGEVFINPEIVKLSKGGKTSKEGCYSLETDAYFDVYRKDSLTLKYTDKYGTKKEEYFFDFKARVIQHEMDHLLGKLCNDQHEKHNI